MPRQLFSLILALFPGKYRQSRENMRENTEIMSLRGKILTLSNHSTVVVFVMSLAGKYKNKLRLLAPPSHSSKF